MSVWWQVTMIFMASVTFGIWQKSAFALLFMLSLLVFVDYLFWEQKR